MGNAAIRPSARVAELLRNRRRHLKLTLREVSEQIQSFGERLPISTLGRIEQGQLEPGVRRLQLLLRFYGISARVIDELTELDVASSQVPGNRGARWLLDQAIVRWQKGNLELGLAHAFAAMHKAAGPRGSVQVRQEAGILAGTYARNLGRLFLAKQIVDDLLCEPPLEPLRWRALLLSASIWHRQGASEVATALLRHASTLIRIENHEAYAVILHQEAKVLLDSGRAQEAATALEHALRHYRTANLPAGELKAHVLKIRVIETLGNLADAVDFAREVLEETREKDSPGLRVSVQLELGRLLVQQEKFELGISELNAARALAIETGDEDSEFLAQYRLWKAYGQAGDKSRSRMAFSQAKSISARLQRESAEIAEVRLVKFG